MGRIMTTADTSRRGWVRALTMNVVGIVWSIGASLTLWWAGVLLWRYVSSCSVLDPFALVITSSGVMVAAVGAGVVPGLLARCGGSSWMAGVAGGFSTVVLGLYAMIIGLALAFGLSGGSPRWLEMVSGAVVTLAPSFALVGANVLTPITITSPRKALTALLAWTLATSAAAGTAIVGTVTGC